MELKIVSCALERIIRGIDCPDRQKFLMNISPSPYLGRALLIKIDADGVTRDSCVFISQTT